jgi:Mg2+-importing ATPase
VPVRKIASPRAIPARPGGDDLPYVYSGSLVVRGHGRAEVTATGARSEIGKIGLAITRIETEPPRLRVQTRRLVRNFAAISLSLSALVVVLYGLWRGGWLDALLSGIALGMSMLPEEFPLVLTVFMVMGAWRISRAHVLTRRVAAIETLGAATVLCTDKTGTLTEAVIRLVGHPGPDGKDSERALTLAGVNSCFESGIRSPLDQAIVARCGEAKLEGWSKIDEVPFDFERRAVSVLAAHDGQRILIIKGAPEPVLAKCAALDTGAGGAVPLDVDRRAALDRFQHAQASLGFRVLAVAWKRMPDDCREIRDADERDLVIAGFCVFVDPPKASAAVAIARLAAAGIRVKVVSGDHEAVVRHLVESLGLTGLTMLTGGELAALTDPALSARIDDVDLFARVSPDQKTRIIRALQARGHTVGFIGDGVNDAPAIHAAEVGISVDGATDVARSAADMILLAQDLGVVADGVEEGRRTFANILKYVRMGTSSNFGNMLSMALASLVLPFLPLLPVQILLNNLLYDLSEIGIPFDAVDREDVARPRAWDMGDILRFTLVTGALSSLFDVATFAILRLGFDAGPELFRTAWFVESTATQILVIFVIRTRGAAWASRAHPALVASSLAALAAAFAIILSPLGRPFGFTGVPFALVAVLAALVAAYLAAAEVAKRFASRRPAS